MVDHDIIFFPSKRICTNLQSPAFLTDERIGFPHPSEVLNEKQDQGSELKRKEKLREDDGETDLSELSSPRCREQIRAV